MSIDAMKLALEALEDAVSAWRAEMEFRSCIDAAEPWAKAAEVLRAEIEQRKPVAWRKHYENSGYTYFDERWKTIPNDAEPLFSN
jgi:hypothetical protein